MPLPFWLLTGLMFGVAIFGAVLGLQAQQELPLEVRRLERVTADSAAYIVRLDPDPLYERQGVRVQCYITNPDRFGPGHPSLSCVALSLPR